MDLAESRFGDRSDDGMFGGVWEQLYLGRYICVLCPKKTSAASMTVSDNVGCGCIVHWMSDATAAISMASTPSAINSPAPAPTIPTPNTRSVSGSMISLVRPSLRPNVVALPDARQGKRATSTGRFWFFACVSVRPHHAISGSVKTTAGIPPAARKQRCGRQSLPPQ